MDIVSSSEKNYFLWSYFLFAVLVGLFSPVFGYVFSVIGLIFSNRPMARISRMLFALASLFFFFVIYASRDFEAELREDLSIYYMVLDGLRTDFDGYYKFFGGGVEIGWPILYAIVDGWWGISSPE